MKAATAFKQLTADAAEYERLRELGIGLRDQKVVGPTRLKGEEEKISGVYCSEIGYVSEADLLALDSILSEKQDDAGAVSLREKVATALETVEKGRNALTAEASRLQAAAQKRREAEAISQFTI
jgi:hypothetical protein